MSEITRKIIFRLEGSNCDLTMDYHLKENGYEVEFEHGFENSIRYLKGIYRNTERFKSRFIDVTNKWIQEWGIEKTDCGWSTNMLNMDVILGKYEEVEPFTYREAFELKDEAFKRKVFGTVSIPDMMQSLGKKKIKTEGVPTKHKVYSPSGEFLHEEEKHNVYELYEIDGKDLGVNEALYAVKCWCTTTDKEHWLWIESEYKNDVLTAIASTFRVHEKLIPHIKELKRQGDILIAEFDKDGDELMKSMTEEDKIIPLTKEQYFNLLTTQS